MAKYYTLRYPDPVIEQTEPTGGSVEVHDLHGKFELELNLKSAIVLAKHGYTVRLLPISDVPDQKNPDAFLIDEEIFVEFKHTHSARAIDRAIRMGRKQADHVLIHVMETIERGEMLKVIKSRVRRCESIKTIFLILEDVLYRFSREEVDNDLIDDKIQ